MNDELISLQKKIQKIKGEKEVSTSSKEVKGYNISMIIMTDLISCILVGLAIGIFLQKFFHTSVLLTLILVILGGIAGLYTTIRFAMNQDRK